MPIFFILLLIISLNGQDPCDPNYVLDNILQGKVS